jgi:tetratricopeptide (TPR) repeat protein
MVTKLPLNINRFYLFFVLLFLPGHIFSQTSRDVRGAESSIANEGKTRALIIGISKYQFIDSLQYADRDAQVFADYLRNNNFWHIQKDDITLLMNDKAKNGDLITQLARIARASNPGDNLLFYFSGHGDVETLTQFNNGYLLAYDTYTNNYIAGALPISFLKELFVTLLNKNVKVLLVTDACRSGKLAGGMKGAEFAASAISNMWKNEIKILSSQPGQLSFEGTKWGNGRGVFSYYLVKGLNGEADADKDSVITLAELEMYVGNNVARETGNKQQPIFEGPNKYSTVLARLSAPVNMASPKPAGNRFMPSYKIFRLPEDSCADYYQKMVAAIRDKKFDRNDPLSATALYNKLKSCTKDTGLILQANSQLLGALMNGTQEIVNNSFIGQKWVQDEDFGKGRDLIDQVIKNNDLQLPYDQHLNNLNRYFLVMQNTTEDSTKNKIPIDHLELMIDSALEEEPDAAYLLTAKSRLEMKRQNWENAIALQEQSLEKSPGWLTPKYYLGMAYANTKSYDKAMAFYEEVLEKDSLHQTVECTKCALKSMADWAKKLKMDKKSEEYFIKSLQFVPDLPEVPDVFENNFIERAGKRNIMKEVQKELAGMPFPKFVLDSIMAHMEDSSDLGGIYYMKALQFKKNPGNPDSATFYLTKAVWSEPDEVYYLESLTDHLEEQGKDEQVQSIILAKIKNYDGDDQLDLKITLAASYLKTRKLKESFKIYKELIEAGGFSCKELRNLKSEFDKLPEYNEYIKHCKDKEEGRVIVNPPVPPKKTQ